MAIKIIKSLRKFKVTEKLAIFPHQVSSTTKTMKKKWMGKYTQSNQQATKWKHGQKGALSRKSDSSALTLQWTGGTWKCLAAVNTEFTTTSLSLLGL